MTERHPRKAAIRANRLALGGLAGCSAMAVALALGVIPAGLPALLTAVGLVATVLGMLIFAARARVGGETRLLLLSPLAPAALVWVSNFVYRPLELYAFPSHAHMFVAWLGFDAADLIRTTALAAVGCATWGIGYLLALGRIHGVRPRRPRMPRVSISWAVIVAVAGTVLWVALFLRQGGPSALIDDPGSIRANQQGGVYSYVGIWMLQGVALFALVDLLQNGRREARKVLVFTVPSALACAICLQIRGHFVFGLIAAALVALALGFPRNRGRLVALIAAGVLALPVLALLSEIRTYNNVAPLGTATREALRSPPSDAYEADLSTFDTFVAVQELVPGSLDYYAGRSLTYIPLSIVPRILWPDKPNGGELALDQRITHIFQPDASAGTPITIQGELYVNFGLGAIAVGSLALGYLLGIAAGWGRVRAGRGPLLVVYAVIVVFVGGWLTRPLGPVSVQFALSIGGMALASLTLLPARRRVADFIERRSPSDDLGRFARKLLTGRKDPGAPGGTVAAQGSAPT